MIRGKIARSGNNESHEGANWIAPFRFRQRRYSSLLRTELSFQPDVRQQWESVSTSGERYRQVVRMRNVFRGTSVMAGPFVRGTQWIVQAISVSGNTFTSAATVTFYDVNGNNVLGACAVAQAHRFQ